MKEVASEMDISITLFKQGIIVIIMCQILFVDKVLLKQNVDKEMIITSITCLILESASTSDYYKINRGVSKSTRLEPTIKHLMKETRLCW